MAVIIIDRLEVVHIDQDESQVVGVGALHQKIVSPAVEQPGKRVMGSLVAEFLLDLFIFVKDIVVDPGDIAQFLHTFGLDVFLLLHTPDHSGERFAYHLRNDEDDRQNDQHESDRQRGLHIDQHGHFRRGILQLRARGAHQCPGARVDIRADAIFVVHVIIAEDNGLRLILHLSFCQIPVFRSDIEFHDLGRDRRRIVIPRFHRQAHRVVFQSDQLVGNLEGLVQAVDRLRILPVHQSFYTLYRMVSALGHIHFFVKSLRIFDLSRYCKASDTIGQIIRPGAHVRSGVLRFDILIARPLHPLVSVRHRDIDEQKRGRDKQCDDCKTKRCRSEFHTATHFGITVTAGDNSAARSTAESTSTGTGSTASTATFPAAMLFRCHALRLRESLRKLIHANYGTLLRGARRLLFRQDSFLFLKDERLEIRRGNRLREEIALHEIAAKGFERVKLVLRFNALRDDRNRQVFGDLDDDLQHMRVAIRLERVADKLYVKLHRVDRQSGDHAQRGISCTEIVHLDLESHLLELRNGFDDLFVILRVCGFRDFQQQILSCDVVFVEDPLQCLRQVGIVHIHSGNVDRDRDRVIEFFFPLVDLSGGFLPDIQIESLDQSVIFKQRDEYPRTDHPKFRVDPPHQRFRACQDRRIRPYIELRLIVHLELSFRDRDREVFDQLLRVDLFLVETVIIDRDILREASSDSVRGQLRPVKTPLDIDVLIDILVDSHPETDPVFTRPIVRQDDGRVVHDLLIVIPMGAVHHKGIGVSSADDSVRIGNDRPHLLSDPSENLVSVGFAVALIDHVEVVDIHNDRIHREILVILVKLLRVTVKVFSVIQSGQLIPFRELDDIPVFRQLDRVQDPGLDHAFHRIGLRHEVDRAQVQALDFRFFFRGRHDHGNEREFRILPYLFQHLDSGHHRHQNIQQKKRQCFLVTAEHLHRLRSVTGVKNLILVLQDVSQYLPVDQFIIGNQDLPLAVGGMKFLMIFRHRFLLSGNASSAFPFIMLTDHAFKSCLQVILSSHAFRSFLFIYMASSARSKTCSMVSPWSPLHSETPQAMTTSPFRTFFSLRTRNLLSSISRSQ